MRKIKKYQFPAGPLTTGNKLFDSQLAVQRSSYDFNKSLKSMQSSLYPEQQNPGGIQFTVGDASTGFTPQMTQTTPFGTNTTNMLTGATTTNYNTSSEAPADNSGGGTLSPAIIIGSGPKLPSFNTPLTVTNMSTGLLGIKPSQVDADKRNSAYKNVFGATYDQLQSKGIDIDNYSSADEVKKAYKDAKQSE